MPCGATRGGGSDGGNDSRSCGGPAMSYYKGDWNNDRTLKGTHESKAKHDLVFGGPHSTTRMLLAACALQE